MPECIDCGSFTKYENGRCYDCYEEYHIELDEKFYENEKNFRINLTKGKIAETIVEQMLITCEFDVHRFGMENSVPNFPYSIYKTESMIGKSIRSMPDFVVVDPWEGDVHYVEVKYRKNGYFNYKKLGENYPYPNGFLILLSKNGINGISVKELKHKGAMNICDDYPIWDLKPFEQIDKDTVEIFVSMTKSVFEKL